MKSCEDTTEEWNESLLTMLKVGNPQPWLELDAWRKNHNQQVFDKPIGQTRAASKTIERFVDRSHLYL